MIAPEVLLSDTIARQVPEGSFLDWPGPIPYAHQGGLDGGAPGNSMAAFEDAWQQGYIYLETDGRATAGGELVALHDPELDDLLVADLSVADRMASQRAGYPIVLIDEILEAFPGARVSLDAKRDERRDPNEDDPAVELCLETIHRHNAVGRVCLASFSARSLQQLRDGAPGAVSTLSDEELGKLAIAIEDQNFDPEPLRGQVASVPPSIEIEGQNVDVVTPEFLAECHKRGIKVHVWTINDADEMRRLLDMGGEGVDGIYTDELVLLKRVLIERGQWFS